MLRRDGETSADEVIKVATDWRSAALNEQEFAVLEYAERLTQTPILIGRDDLEPLREVGLDDDQILAAILAICYRNFIARSADMLGVEQQRPDESAYLVNAFEDIVAKRKASQAPRKSPAATSSREVEGVKSESGGSASFLSTMPGTDLLAVLQARPSVAAGHAAILQAIQSSLPSRWQSLISVCIAGLLGLDHQVAALRGELEPELAEKVAANWPGAPLDAKEMALLGFAHAGTVAQATITEEDIGELRSVGLSDRDILAAAALTAYDNHALRASQALGVLASRPSEPAKARI